MRIDSVRRFIAAMALALLLLTVLHVAMTSAFRSLNSGAFGEFNRVARGEVNAGIIVSGSSRAALHYDTKKLRAATGLRVFNLGRIGARAEVYHGILSLYLRHNRKPRLHVLNADLNSLGSDPSLYQPIQYTPYLDDPGLYAALRNRHPNAWLMRYVPLYGYTVNDLEFQRFQPLREWIRRRVPEKYDDGYLVRKVEWSEPRARTFRRKAYYYDETEGGRADFRRSLTISRSSEIPAIVVLSPVHREVLSRTANLASTIARIRQTAIEEGAEFWDYSALEPVSGSNYYFGDPFHLNYRGASEFSEAIGKRIREWLERHPGPDTAGPGSAGATPR